MMRMPIRGELAVSVLLLSSCVSATVLRVPSEYATIQAGIDAAAEGDTVLVARGTYTGPGNRNIDFGGKAILVVSQNGPAMTTIDCGGGGRGFGFHNGEGPSSIVQGFTIRNGSAYNGGGIYCLSSSPTIKANRIIANSALWDGGGMYCLWSSPMIEGNTIAGNSAADNGGGIYCQSCAPPIEATTLFGNAAASGGGICCGDYSSPSVTNSVLWGDSAGGSQEIFVAATGTIEISYSDVESGWPGEGNIDADPIFVWAEKGDCRLLWGSPCIDAGDPGLVDPDGTRRDMGAHPFDQSKELLIYLSPQARIAPQGGTGSVLYTIINCHDDAQPCWADAELVMPDGEPWPWNPLEGPSHIVVPPESNEQLSRTYTVPGQCPLGTWTLRGKVGFVGNRFDKDAFAFTVIE
jgi:predicted outer membrane repeat protein